MLICAYGYPPPFSAPLVWRRCVSRSALPPFPLGWRPRRPPPPPLAALAVLVLVGGRLLVCLFFVFLAVLGPRCVVLACLTSR